MPRRLWYRAVMSASHPLLSGLNPAQADAVRTVAGPVAVLAGAGSGKTRVITRRIAWMVSEGIDARRILAVTFTNKAAREMKARAETLLGSGGARVGTFHSFCSAFLREEFPSVGRQAGFSIYDDGDSLSVVKRVMDDLDLDRQRIRPEEARRRIGRWKGALLLPGDLEGGPLHGTESHHVKIYGRYEEALLKSNACDFDDLLLHTWRLLRDREDVLLRWHSRITHVLVDEFQDTNPVQYAICKLLTGHTRNLCVTGDQDQSIYSWRGANPEGFDEFLEDHPEAALFRLEQNYRSTGSILRAASELISRNRHRIPKRLWTAGGDGEPVEVAEYANDEYEAVAIGEAIRSMGRQGRSLSEIAVFFRTNAQSLPLERALTALGIPYVMIGGLEFFARQEVKDMLAWLRFLANPKDLTSLLRIINVPSRGIGAKTIQQLLAHARGTGMEPGDALLSSGSAAGLPPRAGKSLGAFKELAGRLAARIDGSCASVVRAVLEETGYGEHLKQKAEGDGSRDPLQNIGQLLSLAAEFDKRQGASLSEFLAMIALMTDHDRADASSEAVSLMTLHASKGLEFPVAIVAGLEEDLLPHSMAAMEPSGIEEERRLLYVGMTRAKERLILTLCRERMRFGRTVPAIPSRFLAEIGSPGTVRTHSEIEDRWRRPERRQDDDFDGDHPLALLRIGSPVWHPEWGRGRVRGIRGRGDPLDRKVVVAFEDGAERQVILRHSAIEPLEQEEP